MRGRKKITAENAKGAKKTNNHRERREAPRGGGETQESLIATLNYLWKVVMGMRDEEHDDSAEGRGRDQDMSGALTAVGLTMLTRVLPLVVDEFLPRVIAKLDQQGHVERVRTHADIARAAHEAMRDMEFELEERRREKEEG